MPSPVKCYRKCADFITDSRPLTRRPIFTKKRTILQQDRYFDDATILLAIYIFLGNRFTDEPEEISSNHNRVFPISSIIMRTIIIISIFVTNPPLLLKFTFANISSGEKEGEKKLGKSNSLLVQRYRFQVSVSASYVPGGGGESEARERFNITPTSQARE